MKSIFSIFNLSIKGKNQASFMNINKKNIFTTSPNLLKTKFLFSNNFNKINIKPISFLYKLGSNHILNFPNKKFSSDTKNIKEEFQKFASNYEENFKKISELVEILVNELKSLNEERFFEIIKQLNSYPIRYGEFHELKASILSNICDIPMQNPSNFIEFINFFDKFDMEHYDEHFNKILPKYQAKLNYFNPEQLVIFIYSLSKFRIYDQKIWGIIFKIISPQLINLSCHSLSKLFLGLSMLKFSEPSLFTENSPQDKIFGEIIHFLSHHLKEINSQDVFRVCISLTKKPLSIYEIPESVWERMREVFINNLQEYDLYQISQILLLYCETQFTNDEVFTAVERDIIESYFDKVENLKKLPDNQINLGSLLEDLAKISFSLALTIRGSLNFWNKFFKVCISLQKFITNSCIESLHFIIYRNVDYFSRNFSYDNLNKNLLDECYKNLDEIISLLEKKIREENLLSKNQLDPFNMMMLYARLGNNNFALWNYITKNISNVLSSPNFQMNTFLLSDLTYAFSSYTTSLNVENDHSLENQGKNSENFTKSDYIKNKTQIWNALETHILNLTKYLDVPYLTNMIVDLCQIDLELKISWAMLTNQFRDFMNKGNIDIDNFVSVMVALKRRNYQDKNLWTDMEKFLRKNIQSMNIEQLKKITVCLVKSNDTESQEIYGLIASRFCDEKIIDVYNFEQFIDLQIPFAIIGIGNDKIWNKFEEILFKNFDIVKENKPLILSTIFSFSRLGKGSSLVWNKFAAIISEKLSEMDIDDLGHLGICIRNNLIQKHNLTKILNEEFWNRFIYIVDNNIANSSLVACNNLIIIFKENDIIKGNTKIIKKIEDRITSLSK